MTFRLVLLAAALTVAVPAIAKPVVGQPAPDFSVTDAAGKTQSLSAYKGKTVDLNGGGLKEQLTRQVCDKILDQAKSFL